MFELQGDTYTLKELEDFASQQNLDFDSFISDMKTKGLVDKREKEDTKQSLPFGAKVAVETGKAFETGVDIATGLSKIVKSFVTDKDVRQKTFENIQAVKENQLPELQRQFLQAQNLVVDLTTRDFTGMQKPEVREKAEDFLKENFKEIETINKFLIKDTGEGIVKGIKQGDAADFIGGIVNANAQMAQTVVPSLATGGLSLPFQVISPMYSDYNVTKAKSIYGEDDLNAINKLIDNDQTELVIPATLGLFATSLEYVGFKGITRAMFSNPGARSFGAKLLLAGNKEGLTEWGQNGIEGANQAFAEGKSVEEAGQAIIDNMFSEAGVESYLNGFVGSTGITTAGKAINRALTSDKATLKEIDDKITEIAKLNIVKNSTRDEEVKNALEQEIEQKEQDFKKYITDKRKVSELLNSEQKINLVNLIKQKDNIRSKAESLKNKLKNNQITTKDFGYAIRSLNNQSNRITEQIELINETAKKQTAVKAAEDVSQIIKETGLEGEVTELSSEEISKLDIKQAKKASEQFGFIAQRKDGSFNIILNEDKPSLGTAAHELMHAILYKTIGGNQELQDSIGSALTSFVNDTKGGVSQAFINRMKPYINDKNFGEEVITVMSESMLDGSLNFNENLFTKLRDSFRRFYQKITNKDVEFNTGRDVYNFIKDYNKNIKEGKLSSRILKAATEGIKGKLVKSKVKPEDIVQMSKEASDNVQRLYDTKETNFEAKIINEFKPIVSRIVERRSQAPNFDRELLTSEIEIGERGILDLIRDYKPDSGVPLAAYINKFLPARAIEASRRVLGEEFTEDVTEARGVEAREETVEVKRKPKPKKIVLADRLNVKSKVDKAIKEQLPKLDVKELTFKKLKNLVPDITSEMFGISSRKLKTLANITKGELQAAQMFINKNADLLIAMLPEGSTLSGTSTGVPNTLLKAFYTKTDRAKMAKTGSTSGLAIQVKNKINKKEFLEVFGIVDGKPQRDDRNTSARVLALANLTGKMMTNQAVRENLQLLGDSKQTIQNIEDGVSSVMFSKSVSNLGLIDFKKLINDPKDGINNFDLFTDKMVLLATYMPPGLIRVVDLRNFGITNSAVKDYARSTTLYQELGVFTIGKSQDRDYLRPDASLGKNVKDITKAKVEKYNESGQANFNAMVEGIRKAIKDNPKDKELHSAIFTYLSSAVNDTSHPLRTGAKYVGGDITATGGIIYEHAVQNAYVRDLLIDTLLNRPEDFNKTLKAIKKNYKLIALSKKDANAVDTATYIDESGNLVKYKNGMGVGWDIFVDNWFDRYFNTDVNAVDPNKIIVIENGKTFAEEYGVTMSGKIPALNSSVANVKIIDKAINKGRLLSFSKTPKGISILDFDDTLATTESLVKYTAPNGTTGTLNAEQYASTYEDLLDQGYKFDFSDFNRVVKGKLAPLFKKALKLQSKFGPENMFVLTARPPAAQKPIFDFLKANGLNIPLKNITGLGNSTSEAKALWVADKVGEGYNDFYFADDALQNVQAVDNVLEQFDVKRKVQQARVQFSKGINETFNDIIEDVKGIDSQKRYSQAKARKRGEGKGRFRFFIPPSHEDFVGLLYNFIGKGEKGNKHRDFFEKALIKPLNRAYNELNVAKQSIANDYRALIKAFPDIRKKLTKKTPDGDFYYSDAIRVYLWNKAGFDIPGMSKTDIQELVDLVTSEGELQAFADNIGLISKQEQGYVEPSEEWQAGDIRTDLQDATGRVGRKKFFAEFIENADIIFSQENLNKIEAAYGIDFREALEDVLYRTKTGTNRTVGQNKIVNRFLDYLNGSIGATMFFNARSAVLQTISTVNFINFGDNNIFAASRAFANQKQFWSDFAMLFNSDMLKQRRAGVAFDVNANEIANAVSKSKQPVRAAIRYLLQIGFLPTQLADSFAISLGGASMYRNRVNTYLKQGLEQKEAETKAFNDFQEISESTQQSARPDKISQQQASPLGRMILAFQNTPSQYVRLMKKAALDLVNRRKTPPYDSQAKSDMSNISKIIYYGAIQNVIFYGLQSAMFAMLFDDDEKDEEFFEKKRDRILNGSLDTILRGMGVGGAVISTIKNTAIKYAENQKKDWGKEDNVVMMEMLQLSPPIGIKARKLSSAQKTMDFNKKVIEEMDTFDIDNPVYSAIGNLIEATTNIPLARLHRKTMNLREAANAENEWWQRLAMALGWSRWDVGVENKEVEAVKKEIKQRNKTRKGEAKRTTRKVR